ncbi:MAG: 3-isopropylmalate dehydratase small subunit [Candidatus Lambdaproteobacteria bacterium RIFOXYD2_FULL_50_16]|uniref:3-isopropylmalate dehydratase small subunit n=1 Tax=Candidatus Lambdaproteobacteria bacterium RIFOXYD2_FULL_50_16 TaxID=1817772 RepID=A0A1F6GEV5_9PROT|nr:MAG: 3-isopropylmalate dehydratase small subunit [Candidatus Lambdaproteobacteria bacterium RIFOXYD2_FULL_50_16]
MQAFTKTTGVAAVLNKDNIDTDQIIAKQFLKKTEKTGFGKHLFHDWRFLADGSENPDFELNRPEYKGARVLITGDNFGCGSSREHAPWALVDYGFKTIVATSYADIFFNNCFKNGILPIIASFEDRDRLAAEVLASPGVSFTVDLLTQKLTTPGGIELAFEVDPMRKEKLVHGLDDIDWTLTKNELITAFEAKQKAAQPWLYR